MPRTRSNAAPPLRSPLLRRLILISLSTVISASAWSQTISPEMPLPPPPVSRQVQEKLHHGDPWYQRLYSLITALLQPHPGQMPFANPFDDNTLGTQGPPIRHPEPPRPQP